MYFSPIPDRFAFTGVLPHAPSAFPLVTCFTINAIKCILPPINSPGSRTAPIKQSTPGGKLSCRAGRARGDVCKAGGTATLRDDTGAVLRTGQRESFAKTRND